MENIEVYQNSNFQEMDLNALADYIVEHHHYYLGKNLPVLWDYMQQINQKQHEKYPELAQIAEIIEKFVNHLPAHMVEEENILFPYIRKLNEVRQNKDFYELPPFQFLHKPIDDATSDHAEDLEALTKIRELSQNFTPPADACETHRLAFAKLAEFEEDMRKHIDLENNILFPKAMQLEKELWLV